MSATGKILALMEAYTLTGPARNLLRLARYFNQEGPLNIAIATFVRRNPDNGFVEAVRREGLELHLLREHHRFDPFAWIAFRKLSASAGIHLVQSHGVKAHLYCATRSRSIPWLAYHHGYTDENVTMRLYNRINQFTLPRANLVLTVCQPFREDLIREGVDPRRIRVLPNALDETLSADPVATEQWRQHLGLDSFVGPTLLTVGRLSREKGHRLLLDALGAVRPDLPRWRLLVVGDGIERHRLEQQAVGLGLSDRVVFLGHQPDPGPFYRLANIFLLPSLSEGSSNALLEAMLSGLCCLASSAGGNPETIGSEHAGFVLPFDRPDAWTTTIEHLLAHPEEVTRVGQAGQERVRKHFSFAAYREQILHAYRTLVNI